MGYNITGVDKKGYREHIFSFESMPDALYKHIIYNILYNTIKGERGHNVRSEIVRIGFHQDLAFIRCLRSLGVSAIKLMIPIRRLFGEDIQDTKFIIKKKIWAIIVELSYRKSLKFNEYIYMKSE